MLKGEIKKEAELIEQCKVATVKLGYFVKNILELYWAVLQLVYSSLRMCFTLG